MNLFLTWNLIQFKNPSNEDSWLSAKHASKYTLITSLVNDLSRIWLHIDSLKERRTRQHCKTSSHDKNTAVCFNLFGTLYDGVTPEVIEIILFWKKYLKGYCLAFYTKQFLGIFYIILVLFAPWGSWGQIMQKKVFFSLFNKWHL